MSTLTFWENQCSFDGQSGFFCVSRTLLPVVFFCDSLEPVKHFSHRRFPHLHHCIVLLVLFTLCITSSSHIFVLNSNLLVLTHFVPKFRGTLGPHLKIQVTYLPNYNCVKRPWLGRASQHWPPSDAFLAVLLEPKQSLISKSKFQNQLPNAKYQMQNMCVYSMWVVQ